MKSIVFEGTTWNEYENIKKETDKVLHKHLSKIIKDLQREDPEKGLGMPEPLKHNLSGFGQEEFQSKIE